MWVLSGPFDGEITGEVGFHKAKLLKTGSSYPLGRKERSLVVNNKKISHDHCEFIVGKYTLEDVTNPLARPTLEFVNKKNKVMKITRGDQDLGVNPSATEELQHGDVLSIVTDIPISIQWMPVCCFSQVVRGKPSVSLQACASLGINIVHTPNPHVTHHLTSTFAANYIIAASLLSACQFVKPEWLNEVIRLGNLPLHNDPSSGTSLEQLFSLPSPTKFRPSFSPSLPSSLKVFKVWEPNEERLNMFKGSRFLCVGEKGREMDGGSRELISRGGGSVERFDVGGGRAKWHKALSSARAKGGVKNVVVVADEQAMKAAVGKDAWNDLNEEAKIFGLRFISPENITQAVMNVDASFIDSTTGMDVDVDDVTRLSSPLPDFVPNTHPDEPSLAPPEPEQEAGPSRRLTRRGTSHRASQEPGNITKELEEEESEAPRPPRRALTRRAKAGQPVIIGIDDPSSIIDAVPDLSAGNPLPEPENPPFGVDLPAPTPARSSRLKRRVGTGVQNPLDSQAFSLNIEDPASEPPLKKFKALFEASDPGRTGAESFDENGSNDAQSEAFTSLTQTQTQTQAQGKGDRTLHSGGATELGVVREEEEETQSGMGSLGERDGRGTKRKAGTWDDGDEDVEIAGVEEVLNEGSESGWGLVVPKKRAVENVNAVERSEGTASNPVNPHGDSMPVGATKLGKPGAAPGKPDTDAAFLKAIASTKRGKKTEDSFDREFNKLKISKPDLGREEQEKEWAVLDDFGDEANVRGNFMVVMEMEVFRKEGETREKRAGDMNLEWHTRPNFKKFKKKLAGAVRTNRVELVISEENDYGMGAAYWKGGNSQSQSQGEFTGTRTTQKQPRLRLQTGSPRKAKNQALVVNDSDDEVEVVSRKGKSKPSKTETVVTQKRTSTRATNASAKSQPLFLDSDEDDEQIKIRDEEPDLGGDNDDDEVQTLQSSGGLKVPDTATRRSSRMSKTNKAPAIIVDDDSDDDAVFRGFKGKKRGR